MGRDKEDEKDYTFFDERDVMSTTDCTGIAPAMIEDEREAESVGELYAIHRPKPRES